jgi:hypothetical protein
MNFLRDIVYGIRGWRVLICQCLSLPIRHLVKQYTLESETDAETHANTPGAFEHGFHSKFGRRASQQYLIHFCFCLHDGYFVDTLITWRGLRSPKTDIYCSVRCKRRRLRYFVTQTSPLILEIVAKCE